MKPLDKPLALNREALVDGLDPGDADATRGFVLTMAAHRFQHQGGLPPAVLAFTAEHLVIADLDGQFDVGQEKHAAAALEALGRWDGVVRAFRVGEALHAGDDGSMRRVLGVCELDPESGSWWLAWCRVGQGEAGVGVLLGEGWTLSRGTGPEAAPDPFREWIDSEDVALHLEQPQWHEKQPEIDVQCAFRPLGDEVPPDELGDLVHWMERRIIADLHRRGAGHLGILVLRPDSFEQWEFRGEIPCSVDDVARNIARFGEERAVAVGITMVKPVTLDGAPTRAVGITVERQGKRAERILPMKMSPDGKITLPQSFGPRDHGAVPLPERWIGVEPSYELTPYLLGSHGGVVPEG